MRHEEMRGEWRSCAAMCEIVVCLNLPNSPVCIPQDCVRILHKRSDLRFISQARDVQYNSLAETVVMLQRLELVPDDFFFAVAFLLMMMLPMMITVSCVTESLQRSGK